MSLLTIFHIYFNYNYDVLSFRWIHSSFTRHLQFAFRMLVAFLIGGFITYASELQNHLTLKFMIPNMSILCIQETFGLTLSTNIRITLIIVPLSIFFFILQKIGLGYHNYIVENRINYCLYQFQQMHTTIIQAFLSRDEINSKLFLSRSMILEQMIREIMMLIQTRLNEARYEPSQFLQRLFNRQRKQIFDLSIQEQEDLMNTLLLHICSLQLMVKQCKFNEYHQHFINELESSLKNLSSAQTQFISNLLPSSINHDEFQNHLLNLQTSFDSLRSAYIKARLHRIEQVFQSSTTIRSRDHLSHAFFLFQLGTIVRLLTKAVNKTKITKQRKKRKSLKEYFKPEWSRFLSAVKSMIIIGVGSVFVMVPRLASVFENGIWIMVALCMSQGDTVGGAFTTMKMRLIGTLLGAMWAYITYLSANNYTYGTLGMLAPWIFLCGYLKLFPQWGYIVTVAASTPIVVNLGRLPFGDKLPGGNYALLRIQQNLVGISIAMILTLILFPVFAMDLLKENIQATLKLCKENIESIHCVYDKVFQHEHSDKMSTDFSNRTDVEAFFNIQRSRFHQLINNQRTLVDNASIEPSFHWLNKGFSKTRYRIFIQQQTDLYRMLNNINTAVMRISECSNMEDLRLHAANGLFLPDLHNELVDLNRQLNDCLNLWSSYFSLTQTKCFQLIRGSFHHRNHLIKTDLFKYEQCLIQLKRIVVQLQHQHQEATDQVLKHYLTRFVNGEITTNFVPYATNDQADSVFIAISSMYYSTTQLAQAALDLGTTIYNLFEIETIHSYQHF
ncbi:hypothetical protein I4U23_005367 [Adineta vaga]|nr:hypothetical protein I4U23_005367 [Adineta vaga]